MKQLRQTLRFALLPVALLLALPAVVAAAAISGSVTDTDSGAPLQGALVSAGGESTTTDRFGNFRITGLDAGSVSVRVSYVGYAPFTQTVTAPSGALDFGLESNLIELEAFTAQARANAQAQALNLQRANDNLTNVVSADVLGRFPDQNVAESINRLPGISIERDQGEGRFVVIRGINPDLNSVALDGVQLASPDAGQRATLLDTIPSDALQQVEVSKTVLPSQPHDAIGGYINIATPSAFDQDRLIARLSGQFNYSELRDEWTGKFSGAYGVQFGENNEFGFMLSGSLSEYTFGSDNFEAAEWTEEDGFFINDDELQPREYDLTRERLGLAANFEYKPDENTLVFIRGSYNNYQDVEVRDRGTLLFGEEAEDPITGDDVGITSFSDITADSYRASDVIIEREMKDREENLRVAAFSTGFEMTRGNWDFDGTLAYSLAEEDTPYDFEVKYVLGTDDFDDLADNPDFIISNTRSSTPTFAFVPGSGIDPTDASNYEFDAFDVGSQIVEETDLSFGLDARYNIDEGLFKYVQVGTKVRLRNKKSDASIAFSGDNPGSVDNFVDFVDTDSRDPYGTNLPYISDSFYDFYLANQADFDVDFTDGESVFESTFEDFDSDEDIYAAYIMTEISTSEQYSLILGLRVEHTEFETTGFVGNGDEEVVTGTVTESKDYTNWMPGVHYRYNFSDDLVFRASWTNTLARPSFEQSAARQVFPEGFDLDAGEAEEGEFGNPNLDPFTSTNFDTSLEYYLPASLGVVSAAVFYKDIKNFIYEQTTEEVTVNFDGTEVVVEEFSQFVNGESGSILGLELAYQQQLTMLPEPWDGLGFWANYTITSSEADVQIGDEAIREAAFLKQSDEVGSIALSYEKYGFFIRVSGSYRSDYVDSYEGGANDVIVDEFLQWDVSTSYQINEQFTAFANFVNVNNEPFVTRWANDDRIAQFEEYDWNMNIGLKWSY